MKKLRLLYQVQRDFFYVLCLHVFVFVTYFYASIYFDVMIILLLYLSHNSNGSKKKYILGEEEATTRGKPCYGYICVLCFQVCLSVCRSGHRGP